MPSTPEAATRAPVSDLAAERLLHDLVAIPSVSTDEDAAVDHLVGWMREQGYDEAYRDDAGNAVGVIGAGPRQVVLLGHIDTVAGFPDVRMDGRALYGRGTVDAKGPLSTFAIAARRAHLPPDVQVVVIGAVEEEASSRGARAVAQRFQPELCVIGEPSQWDRITLGYKGRLIIDWRWEGALAHSAGQALSPAERAVAYWNRVLAYADAYNADINALFGRLDVTLQAINSGQNGVNGWATMQVGFRLPPGINPETVAADLAPDDDAEAWASGHELAFVGGKDTTLSRALRGAIRAQEGVPRFVHKTGTSDMNIVGPIWDCPIVAYGPGDSALDHTPDEHVDLDEYLRAIVVLTVALERL